MLLERIHKPNDVKQLSESELPLLAEEIRQFLIDSLSNTGGHLASNLGVIELTIALHRVCNLPKDKIVWDVGHQAYTHKILTGRKEGFETLRTYGGMSGFPKRAESDCDVFDTGHSSTSISAGLGLAWARELTGEDYRVFAVIGDGSLTGGEAYEALNNASALKKNFVIILNDNEMSISENVGGMPASLARIRTSKGYMSLKEGVLTSLEKLPGFGSVLIDRIRRTKSGIKQLVVPGMLFEEMGIVYLGPVDGSDIGAMTKIFSEAASYQGPVIVHVITKKGNGYLPAERHPARFHGTGPYDVKTGLPKNPVATSYTDVFATVMCKLGERNPKVVAVTAAMEDGTGLHRFHNRFPERFFDVGIAEQHAVSFAAALATQGLVPVVALYSSFLQRAYDQVLIDVCMQKLPVVLAVDRAGLVGADGETHQGVFDLSFLTSIPGMTVLAPKNKWELSDMMKYAVAAGMPVAVRYPRGEAGSRFKELRAPVETGKSELLSHKEGTGRKVLFFALGSMTETAADAAALLAEQEETAHWDLTVVNARFAAPFDKDCLRAHFDADLVVTLEDNVHAGGFGEHVAAWLMEEGFGGQVLPIAVEDRFIPHGSPARLKEILGMDAQSVAQAVSEKLS